MKKDAKPLTVPQNAMSRMQELMKEKSAQTETVAEEQSDTQISNQVSKYLNGKPTKEPGDGVLSRVREQVIERESKPATIRLSVDVSERMHERIKIYCATKRIPTTRALVVALLDAFLAEEGF